MIGAPVGGPVASEYQWLEGAAAPPSTDVLFQHRVDAIDHQQEPQTAHTLGGVLIE